MEKSEARRLRTDLSSAERERFEKYGSIDFKSAGATRKRGGSASVPYSHEAVDAAIAASNRTGRRIGRGEAKRIHALLKGRC